MPILHKLLETPECGNYLPFALSQMRQWSALLGATWQKKFVIDGFRIELEQVGNIQFIRIFGAGAYFEFMTSGHPTDLLAGPIYRTAAVGVNVQTGRSVIRSGTRADNAATVTVNARPQQATLIDEPVSYPGKKYSHALFESWAPNHSHTGLHFRCYNTQTGGFLSNRGAYTTHAARDVGFDVPWADAQGKAKERAGYVNADWPRASGYATVTDQTLGSRNFGITIDASNQFFVFPTGSITDIDGTEENTEPKQVTLSLPTWVYKPTSRLIDLGAGNVSPGLLEYPEYDWKFHPDGLKASAVVYERAPVVFDSAYFAVDQGSSPLDGDDFTAYLDSTGVGARFDELEQSGYLEQRYNSAPGIIEVTLTITLTGPEQSDFTATATLSEVRRPTTTTFCTLLAGYCWHDIKALDWTEEAPTFDAKRGDMVCLDIERWYRADGAFASFMTLKNLTQAKELQSFYGSKLVDFDLQTLSFALLIPKDIVRSQLLDPRVDSPAAPQAFDYTVRHFGINIFTLNRQREVLYPATMDAVAKAAIEGIKTSQARNEMTTLGGSWTMQPLNDLRTWADVPLTNLRNHFANFFHYKSVASTTPDSATLNWWQYTLAPTFPPTGLLYITEPRFGWYVYTDEILNRLNVTPYSTFFAHPNGSWAFYDQQWIYNKHGMSNQQISLHDALTPFDVSELEHVIFDRVHFKRKETTSDTSFRELYNAAVQRGTDDSTLTEDFDQVTVSDLRATFTKQSYTHPGGIEWLQLKIDWYSGFTGYFPERGYLGGLSGSFSGSGALVDLSLGNLVFSAPDYAGALLPAQSRHQPVTFSSCVLIS